jgi:hypothetical protein
MTPKYKRVINPIVPSNKENPTMSGRLLAKADKEIVRRIKAMTDDVVALFENIPSYAANASADDIGLYVYGLSAEQMLLLQTTLGDIAYKWLVGGMPNGLFWFETLTQEAAAMGLAQSSANLSQLSAVYAASRPIESVIYSQRYIQQTAMAVARDYSHWTGLADDAKVRLSGVIADGVAQGKNPKSVVTDIQDSLNVTRSKARQMAQTDIVGTLRETRWAESDAARDELGIEVRMLWTSALAPTTRKTHAVRSGRVFTTNECRLFYSKDGNRYGCLCAQTECLVDENGDLIASDNLKQGMKRQREAWMKSSQ